MLDIRVNLLKNTILPLQETSCKLLFEKIIFKLFNINWNVPSSIKRSSLLSETKVHKWLQNLIYCFAKSTRSFTDDRKCILSNKTYLLASCWIYISWQLQGVWSSLTTQKDRVIAVFYKVNTAQQQQQQISLEKHNSIKNSWHFIIIWN